MFSKCAIHMRLPLHVRQWCTEMSTGTHVVDTCPVYAVLVWGANGDGAERSMVTIVELVNLRPYLFETSVYGSLIYTVIYISDRLLTQGNPNLHLPPPPELRRQAHMW
jgi:hypothetical protein